MRRVDIERAARAREDERKGKEAKEEKKGKHLRETGFEESLHVLWVFAVVFVFSEASISRP